MPLPSRQNPRERFPRTVKIVLYAIALAVCAALLILGTTESRRVFDVMDYGATGNGAADDAGAIQAAIDDAAAVTGTVTIPAGTFMLGSPLYPRNGISLAGTPGQTILTMSAQSSQTFMVQGSDLSQVSFSDLTFRGGGYTQNVNGLYMVGAQNCRASSLRFEGLYYGMKLGSGNIGSGWVVSDIVARDCLDPLYASHIRDSSFTRLDLQAARISDNQDHTIYLERECRNLNFTDCTLSGGSGYTLHLWVSGGSSGDLTFTNLTLDARPGRYLLVIGTGWSDIVFTDSTLFANPEGAVASIYGASDVTFDGFWASGGDSLVGPGGARPDGVVFRNGVYVGSELGSGAVFENVTLVSPDGTPGTTTQLACSRGESCCPA